LSDPVLGSLSLLVVWGGVAEAVGLSTGKLLQISSLSRTKVKSDLILLTASLDFAARRIELA
jgi:hypothetical protein